MKEPTMFLVPVTRHASPLSRWLLDDVPSLRSPSLDVAETDVGYDVSLDLPGVAKDDVKITIDGRHVSVSAGTERTEEKKDGPRVIYRERAAARYARRFTLPEEVDQDASQARLDNGVLSLSLAKKRAAAVKQLTVN
jgi:HSP20 family protein